MLLYDAKIKTLSLNWRNNITENILFHTRAISRTVEITKEGSIWAEESVLKGKKWKLMEWNKQQMMKKTLNYGDFFFANIQGKTGKCLFLIDAGPLLT